MVSSNPDGPAALAPDEWYPAGDPDAVAGMLTVDGERTRLVLAGDPTAPAVVLLHGWAGSAYSFRAVLPRLSQAGLRVIVPDLRGHGRSDKPTRRGAYTAEAMAQRVIAVLDAMRVTPAVMVGQSVGGAITLDVARVRPDLAAGAVLLSPIGFTHLARVHVFRRLAPRGWTPTTVPRRVVSLVMHRIYGRVARWTEHDVDEYWATLRDPDVVSALFGLVREFDFEPRDPAPVAYLGARLRILLGECDRPVPCAEALAHAHRYVGARVDVLPDIGHMPAEEAPDLVARAILQVVESPDWRAARLRSGATTRA